MNLVEVDVISSQAPQAMVDLCHDRLPRHAERIRTIPRGGTELACADHTVAMGEVIQRSAEDHFALSVRIHVGGIEKVNAGFDRVADDRSARFLVERPGRVGTRRLSKTHASDADGGNVQTCATELLVLHANSTRVKWRLLRLYIIGELST